ncbi:MAG: GC-type dockerin domain-anchored protein [Planctomycetota bacterium]|nr:GC-type dockerin domain-anchored protein [Planctomycetota bacterium]
MNRNHHLTVALLTAVTALPALAQCTDTELYTFTDPDGSNTLDRFGSAVVIEGDTAIIGEEGTNRTHIFLEAGGQWRRSDILYGAEHNVELFGNDAAFDNEVLIVGAGVDSDFCNDPNECATGAALIFRRVNGIWFTQAKLQRPFYLDSFNQFGHAVDVDRDTAIVGASESVNGVVIPWDYNGQIWIRQDPLEANDGEEGDSFGRALAIDEDTIVIGAPGDDDNGPQSGSAYVFTRTGGLWSQAAKLQPDDPQASAFFGSAVAIQGDLIAVGSSGPSDSSPGNVYLFTRNNGTWTQQQQLSPAGGQVGDGFGTRVEMRNDTIVVSALWDPHAGTRAGAAYLFSNASGTWTELAKLVASDASAEQGFGIEIALDSQRALIGAYQAFNNGGGAAYLYDPLDPCPCPPDFNQDGTVNTQDVLAFLNAWSNGDPEADFNNDGTINTQDVLAFLNAWSAGC